MLVGQTIGSGAHRFEVEKELGSGAMGTVYKAKFYKDGKVGPVALKMVALGLLGNEGAMARFDREANILKQLRHAHIVRLIATGTYRKTPFIAMEFVDGEALDRLNPRMRYVLAQRFGLDGGAPQTLEEVGAGLGITRERVRQLESRALRELRLVAPGLEFYLRS